MFYLEVVINLVTEQSLEAYLMRTINTNYSDVLRMMICTKKFAELAEATVQDLDSSIEFIYELLAGLKMHTQGQVKTS